jgi:serine O-acetyltransferase
MYQQGSKLRRYLGELIWRWGVAQFGCYLSPLSRIGARLFLPHPTGIVVGEGVIIGKGVTIYQHVTIGKARPEDKAYPVIEDDVILYAGVVIVGDTRVGRGSIIGANAVVLSDVPPFVVAAGSPAKVIKLLRPVL